MSHPTPFFAGVGVAFLVHWIADAARRHRRRGSNPPPPGRKPAPPPGPGPAFVEGRVQRGQGNGGPTTSKPPIAPGGYQPRPSGRGNPNPPPSMP